MSTGNSKISQIMALYYKYGEEDYIGENITQNCHMIQAAMLAEKEGCDLTVVIAAFLHDIGHLLYYQELDENGYTSMKLMDRYGVANHENLGADYLTQLGFGENVIQLIKNHVKAKRYLCTQDESYFNSLSKASQETFLRQGKKMSPEEIKEFEADPYFQNSLLVRKFDDAAKIEDIILPPLSYYREKIEQYFARLNN